MPQILTDNDLKKVVEISSTWSLAWPEQYKTLLGELLAETIHRRWRVRIEYDDPSVGHFIRIVMWKV